MTYFGWNCEHTNFLHQIFFNSDSVHKVKKGKRESNNIDDVFTLQVFLSLFTYFLNPEPKNMPHFFQIQNQSDAILLKGVSDLESCMNYCELPGRNCENLNFYFPPKQLSHQN